MQIVDLLMSSILQLILASLIPFVWWLIFGRRESGFLKWLGFKKPAIKNKTKYVITFVLTILILFIPSFFVMRFFISKTTLATVQFAGQGASALIPAVIYAFLQTGLSEELFFKGFLTKRLAHRFGFQTGNIIQSFLFGLMHGLMFMPTAGIMGAAVAFLFTGIAGWLMGWINEKQSGGSIVSSWLLHGCVNFLASIIAAFNLI